MTQHVRPLTAAVAALGALLGGLAAVPPADAAAPAYVALGDSYSSGTGTRSYLADGTSCQRSVYSYPALIAAARGYALNLRACSGATTADVTAAQLSALTTATSYVTISVGGNDAGFADVLTECALPGWASNCNGAIDAARSFISTTLPARLTSLYASIRSKAPGARVVVVGYPRIFNGEDCNALTWFSPSEETRLNATADLLNATTQALAAAKGFSFANPTDRFVGHAVCADVEYLNGLSYPITDSYHPNRTGHASGYAPVTSPLLTGAALKVSAATFAAARASAAAQQATQRRYAAADARITPESFERPDLTTPAVRAAARRAGINLERWIARH